MGWCVRAGDGSVIFLLAGWAYDDDVCFGMLVRLGSMRVVVVVMLGLIAVVLYLVLCDFPYLLRRVLFTSDTASGRGPWRRGDN